MALVQINDRQWVNPDLVVYATEVQAGKIELHMYGGAVLYTDALPVFESTIEAELIEAKPAKAKK